MIGKSDDATVYLFRTGIGPQKAFEACQLALGNQEWDLVISSGFAGALNSSPVGALVIADQVYMDPSSPLSHQSTLQVLCDEVFREEAMKVGRSIHAHTTVGRVVTVPVIVGRAVEKQKLAQRTGAIALDMESAMVGAVAQNRGLPFVMVRSISDTIDEDLPLDFNLFTAPFNWIRGLTTVLTSPKCWSGLVRLRTQMVQASSQTTKFFLEYLIRLERLESLRVRESSLG